MICLIHSVTSRTVHGQFAAMSKAFVRRAAPDFSPEAVNPGDGFEAMKLMHFQRLDISYTAFEQLHEVQLSRRPQLQASIFITAIACSSSVVSFIDVSSIGLGCYLVLFLFRGTNFKFDANF